LSQCLHFSLSTHKQCILSRLRTTALLWLPKKPYTLAGFEPWIFCSGGGRDGHYATPPGQNINLF
jgi:hypothetical protein